MSNNNIVPGFNDEKDDSLRINLEKVPEVENCLTIYLIGYIDTYNSSFFQKRIRSILRNKVGENQLHRLTWLRNGWNC